MVTKMDLANTNGEDQCSVLATNGNEVNGVTATATSTVWTNSELELPKEKVSLEVLAASLTPPIISPSPEKVIDLPVSADFSPNNAPVPRLPNLPMDEVLSVAVAAASTLNELTGICDSLFPPPLEQKMSENVVPRLQGEEEQGSSSSVEERKPVEEVNHFIAREISPSILRANEEMMSEDEEEHMEIHSDHHSPTEPIINSSKDLAILRDSSSSGSHHSPSPYGGSDSELTTTSGIVSSFNTDSFLYGPSSRECSESVSPDKPLTSMVSKHLPIVPSGVASFTSDPINIPNNATAAICRGNPQQYGGVPYSKPMDMSIHNFPKRHRHVHRAAVYAMHPYHRATCRGGAGVNVAKTLDLLKAVMQSSFNQEIKKLCDDYFQIYGMAAMNIHENTGDSVPQSTLRLLVCKMLEEALHGYQNDKWEFSSVQLPKNDRVSEYKGSPMSTKKSRTDKESKYGAAGKRGRKPTEKAADNRSAWRWSLDKRRLDPVKWSIDKLNPDTKFVLGVNVNKALGHAANRGKVYILHPQLFKYVCDGDDKTWLFDNKYMPVHGGKAFLMIYDEVEMLTKSDDNYRESSEILKSVQNLKRFTVPPFMLNKMREFVKNVQGYFAQENASQSNTNAVQPSTSEGMK